MAESQQTLAVGNVVQAMAWRVKYRLEDKEGRAIRSKLPIRSLGVHPRNRGGVYPGGVRTRSLCKEVVEAGFVKEEVNHAGVAVEEVPIDEYRSRGHAYISGATFNAQACQKDEYLLTCFEQPYDDVRNMLLSHNHMMLVLRAWLTNAKWDLEADVKRGITYCDDKGKLSLPAVAEHLNGKELAEVLHEGMTMEILSWRMDKEEPTAASVISQALNKGNEIALRTTELTAISVLKGEIMTQLSAHVGQRVAFQTVRDRVRDQLDTAADDPDFKEIFDYLLAAGVGTNSYIEDLLQFGGQFVDSKKRQLRFAAFANANAICEKAPWTKIAVIKRAYRKKPTYCFCPSPEAAWGTYEWDHLESLETLLRFFHSTCQEALDKLQPHSRIQILANIDVAATEAFYAAKANKKVTVTKVQELLLDATAKHADQLGLSDEQRTSAEHPWIEFQVTPEEEKTANNDAMKCAPAVIRFDEKTGEQLNKQVNFEITSTHKRSNATPVKLPWRAWRENNASLGASEADRASAVAALQNIHENYDMTDVPIELLTAADKISVVTTGKVKKGTIRLPPCVPKQSKVFDRSEHPHAVKFTTKVMQATASCADASVLRECEFYVLPELKIPMKKQPTTNTAGADAETSAVAAQQEPEWIWAQGGADTMHPFWAVRRLTDKQLQQAKVDNPKDKMAPRFNCELLTKTLSVVCIACVSEKVNNCTRLIEMHFLTNSINLEEGEELLLEITATTKKQTIAKRSWRDAEKAEEKEQKKRRVKSSAPETLQR